MLKSLVILLALNAQEWKIHAQNAKNLLYLFENKCLYTCPAGYYNKEDSTTCEKCDNQCLECS